MPVISHPQVAMHVGGEPCSWRTGQLRYGDFSRLHTGANSGDKTRVHLVTDVGVNAKLLALFSGHQVPHALIEKSALQL